MQAQDVPPYTEGTGLGIQQPGGPEHAVGAPEEHEQGHKKKSVLGKVKDKAKKLKTKIKKPKSHRVAGDNTNDESSNNNESSSASSSDEEDDSQEQISEERDVVMTPGLKGASYDAIPDPHVGTAGGVHEKFGQLRLGDELEGVPSAPGQVSAGVSPYLASHNLGQSTEASRGIPVEEGKNTKGEDLLVSPITADDKGVTPMDYEQPSDVSKTSDNTAAWYTPTSAESAAAEPQKPLKDRIVEGATAAKDTVAATAASGAGAVGLGSYANKEDAERRDTDFGVAPKTTLEQAKEKVLGSSPRDQVELGENKPSITGRAAGTVTGLKDTIAAKLGYGSNKNLTGETDATRMDTTPTTQIDAQNPENKSVLQKIQERAAGATAVVTSKLGYGEKQSPSEAVAEEVNPGDNKSYTQKAYDAAYGAKDAVAAKLGYGGTSSPRGDVPIATEGDNKPYTQKAQETALGAKDVVASKAQEAAAKAQATAVSAKDVVASKLGYGNTDTPAAATEGAYGDDMNVPASTAARFHPGDEDRALSQLITEKMSTGAATVKDTLMRPFGAVKSGPPTPTTTPPPSSATAVMADPEHNTVKVTTTDVPPEEKAGIVGKVTGVVTSLLGTSASGKKKADEAAGKAVEDPQAQTPVVSNVETY